MTDQQTESAEVQNILAVITMMMPSAMRAPQLMGFICAIFDTYGIPAGVAANMFNEMRDTYVSKVGEEHNDTPTGKNWEKLQAARRASLN
jgi:hypothetical protein